MLEAIRERAQGWIAKVILVLITIPFALWGIDSYFSNGGKEAPAAKIDNSEISQRSFAKALKDQQEAMGGKVEEKALRQLVLDQLVNTQILTNAADKAGFAVLEPQVQAVLAGVDTFQENGQFSPARLEAWLKSRGMGHGELMALIGKDLLLKQVQIGYGEGALVAQSSAEQLAGLLAQQREVNEVIFAQEDFAKSVSVDDAAVAAEYAAHKEQYATPAQVRLKYLTLSQAAIGAAIQVSEAQARSYFEANASRFQEPEQRKASHILIKLDPGADAATRQAAKARAEKLLAEVKQAPSRFAELARQHSQDPVSGAQGGDLGTFTRDAMVKPFADAVFSMQPNEISGLVETQFGYHIIRLDGVVPGAKLGFEVVKGEIMQELKQQEAQRRFAEVAERFSNMVYEQADSLEPTAKEFALKLEESAWIGKGQAEPAMLGNARLLEQVFSEDSLKKRQNSEAIEVAPNTLVAARVLDYRPAGVRPLADVANEIRQLLKAQEAKKLALDAGNRALAAAQAGQVPVALSAPMTVSRMQPLNLPGAAIKAVFRADTAKLPVYTGVETAEGYRLYRINRVNAVAMQAPQVKQMRNDLRRMVAQEEMRAYLESMKAKAEIKLDPTALESKSE